MAGLLNDPVADELRLWASQPFVWGTSCCAMSVLAYVERATGRTLEKRPSYTDRRSAARLARRGGGFDAVCRSIMEQLGCSVTPDVQRGDVGLVDLPGSGKAACLCLGTMWAARMDGAVMMMAARPLIGWRLPCPRP